MNNLVVLVHQVFFTSFLDHVSGKEETVQLTVGVHRWKFSFRLPGSNLPSSFEGEYGAVRWWLKVEVDKPFPFLNNTWYKAFTVLSKLNLNEAVYQVNITLIGGLLLNNYVKILVGCLNATACQQLGLPHQILQSVSTIE